MGEIEAKEKAKKEKPKVKTPKRVSFDPQLSQELIEELNKEDWADVDITKVQDLIERGADVNAKDNGGYTPLHWASYNDSIAIAKLLLDAGADLEAKDKWGRTPLDFTDDDEMEALLKKYIK
jgi:hypothetical protein